MTKEQKEQEVWSTQKENFIKETEEKMISTQELEEMVLQYLKQSPIWYRHYQTMQAGWQKRFMEFCTGKKTLPLTYDPFFKRIFHPDVHQERLSRLLSSLLNKQIKVVRILPSEDTLLDGGALVIMDILVELEDGSLANVEVQKIPYLFPAERMSCYSADLLLRQYSRVKGERGQEFKYNDIKKVYTIIIFEKSIHAFHEMGEAYVHMGKTVFDTGLQVELLQEYCLIALDVFRKIPYSKVRNERNGWISLLATEDVKEAELLKQEYPWLAEIYEEMEDYMHKPEEVLDMFSEALKILDRNTVQYMIEQQQEEIEKQKEQLEQKDMQLEQQGMQLEQQGMQLEQQGMQLEQKDKEIERLKQLLNEKK